MKLNPTALGAAGAISFSILWITCSAAVAVLPEFMMTMSGHMVHVSFSQLGWTLTWAGVLLGLVSWAAVAFVSTWLIAVTYNRLLDKP
ncbi:MAG: DUF5676 family membrane protein [Gammaproteobacteria bacterium]|jgi:hypothetical protein|nr:DUF5676 family membrane protein [Gammaproteobacteria bacterium]MDX2460323.1 DUF5676 family membrane protein [Gammaproteobacteria bacterium]